MDRETYDQNRQMLRMLLRHRMKYQDMRTAAGNQLGIKKDGTAQDIPPRGFRKEDIEMLKAIYDANKNMEKMIEKLMKEILKKFLIYPWLMKQKGVDTVCGAWLIGELDIYKETVSKWWQFAGYNSALVPGKKSVKKSAYKEKMGEIIGTLTDFKDGEERLLVLTDTMIRGDKQTPGFLSPFNKKLRTALYVMASSFTLQRAPYAVNYYYPYKLRLENSHRMTKETKKGKEIVDMPWKDTIPKHRHLAAYRYMNKAFLRDMYVEWRTLEGLPVRKSYEEEYLGKSHHDDEAA